MGSGRYRERLAEESSAKPMFGNLAKVILTVGYIIGFLNALSIALPFLWWGVPGWIGLSALLNMGSTLGGGSRSFLGKILALFTGAITGAVGIGLGAISSLAFTAIATFGIGVVATFANPVAAAAISTATLIGVVVAFAVAVNVLVGLNKPLANLLGWGYRPAKPVFDEGDDEDDDHDHHQSYYPRQVGTSSTASMRRSLGGSRINSATTTYPNAVVHEYGTTEEPTRTWNTSLATHIEKEVVTFEDASELTYNNGGESNQGDDDFNRTYGRGQRTPG